MVGSALAWAVRHSPGIGVGCPRIAVIGGTHRKALRNGDLDVFSIGFESCQGHTVYQDARESEIIELVEGLDQKWTDSQHGWASCRAVEIQCKE